MAAEIHNRGRGPEIKGTRITVYDVMEYYLHDRSREYIASLLRLSAEEVDVAIAYFEAHREELLPKYQAMVDRGNQGNSPEILKLLEGSHERLMARKRELEARRMSAAGAVNDTAAR
jgi:uncharacterized protein (DUF433 family)